jgi:hypothetical protein
MTAEASPFVEWFTGPGAAKVEAMCRKVARKAYGDTEPAADILSELFIHAFINLARMDTNFTARNKGAAYVYSILASEALAIAYKLRAQDIPPDNFITYYDLAVDLGWPLERAKKPLIVTHATWTPWLLAQSTPDNDADLTKLGFTADMIATVKPLPGFSQDKFNRERAKVNKLFDKLNGVTKEPGQRPWPNPPDVPAAAAGLIRHWPQPRQDLFRWAWVELLSWKEIAALVNDGSDGRAVKTRAEELRDQAQRARWMSNRSIPLGPSDWYTVMDASRSDRRRPYGSSGPGDRQVMSNAQARSATASALVGG